MKVGYGNLFLVDQKVLGGLWVGFLGEPIPHADSDGLCEEKGSTELQYLVACSSEQPMATHNILSKYSKKMLIMHED